MQPVKTMYLFFNAVGIIRCLFWLLNELFLLLHMLYYNLYVCFTIYCLTHLFAGLEVRVYLLSFTNFKC